MSLASAHYDRLLAKHYTWMFGIPFAAKVSEQKAILETVLRPEARTGLAIDLGSGPGCQSLALAQLGYSPVLAVDTSGRLLEELYTQSAGWNIHTHCADVNALPQFTAAESASVIVCMGDTITHLDSMAAVSELITAIHDVLVPGGRFLISFRDLSTELTGTDRFIPVFSDDSKVMTCFLEFDHPESVAVHDLIYIRNGAAWSLEKSSYRKLRLPVQWLTDQLTSHGFEVTAGQAGRLTLLTGRRQS